MPSAASLTRSGTALLFDVVEHRRGGRGSGIYGCALYQCRPTPRAMSEPTRTKTVNQVRLIPGSAVVTSGGTYRSRPCGQPSRMRSAGLRVNLRAGGVDAPCRGDDGPP